MAIVYNPVTGQLEDNGLGPQGRPMNAPVSAPPVVDPFARRLLQGGVGLTGAAPTTFLPGDGPRGGGGFEVPAPSTLVPQFDFSQGAPGVTPVAPQVPAAAAVAAPVDPQDVVGLQGAAPRTADDLAGVNQGIATTLAAARPQGGLTPVVNNQFNAQNTQAGTGAPANNGINFGFGVNGAPTATEVLAGYRQQDRQARLDQQVQADRLNQASLASQLNDPFASTQDKKIILAQMGMGAQGLQQSAGLATQSAGQALQATTAGKTASAQLANQRLIAQERNQTALQAAELTGGYGLQAAQLKAQAAQATAAAGSGKNRLANAQAELAETQLNATRAAVEAGQVTPVQTVGLVKTGQVPVSPQDRDPLSGVTYTPEEIALLQQARQLQLQQGLLRQQQR